MNKPENKITELAKQAQQDSKKTSEYRNKTETAKNIAEKHLKTIKELNAIADLELTQIEGATKKSVSIQADIESYSTSAKKSYDELLDSGNKVISLITLIEKVFKDHPDLKEEIFNLETDIAKSEELISKINSLYKSSLTKKQEIDDLHLDIHGFNEVNEETKEEYHIDGLKDKLEKTYNELTRNLNEARGEISELVIHSIDNYGNLQKEWENKFITLEKKIESLLPNALTAGLSSAYSLKKEDEIIESTKLTSRFTIGIGGLISVSMIPFVISIISFFDNVPLEQLIHRLPRIVLSILPLYIPVLWFAYSANKKMNLSKRLIEEYTHKEVLSKTYEGLSRQINNIEDEDISSELKIKLLYNILEVSSENPGKLISDYNKSDHPLMDALEKSTKLSKAVEKLENIPGLGKLSKLLASKSKKIIKEQADDIEEALDTVVD